MSQVTMYPAMAGSKRTNLSSDLAADATTAYINDLACLPDAPNLVTFQTDDTIWETCLYTAKSASTGAGTITITRSGTGHKSSASDGALAWTAGAKVSRNPTSLDHDNFKANIEDHETRLIAVEALDVNWTEVTGTTQQASVNKGYIANNASLCTITLPATAAVGDIIPVVGSGAGGWKVAQNSGQHIVFGDTVSTSGTGGYIASQQQYDAIKLICITANTTFSVISCIGNITVV